MRRLMAGVTLLAALGAVGCGSGNSSPVGVTVAPPTATVVLSGTQQFTATVTGTSNTAVNWALNSGSATLTSCPGAGTTNPSLGAISSTGVYTASATLPNPPTVQVTATTQVNGKVCATAIVTVDSGIRVKVTPTNAAVGTGETFTFTATVTGTTNTAVTWAVNNIAGGNCTSGNSNCVGLISSTGVYTAPDTPPTSTLEVTATSAVDTRQFGSAAVSVLVAADPTLTSLDPTTTAQGSVQQDVFLSGSNFFSTSTVLVNGVAVPTQFININSLRATIPSSLLANQGSDAVTVQRQNGDTATPPLTIAVSPVRPTLISSSPESVAQNSGSANVSLFGGYFTSATTVEFNGQPHSAMLNSSQQLTVPLTSADLTQAGLFPLVVRNTNLPSGAAAIAAMNLAVEPPASAVPNAPVASIPVGMLPTAIAINTATATAAVVNHADNTLDLINLDTNTLSATIPVGHAPTGVGIDNVLNEAAVVNSADNTLSIVNLSTQAVTNVALPNLANSTTTPPTPQPTPFSVGMNPLTHRALVAYSSTNEATVVDLSTSPPSVVCVLGGTNLPTGSCAGPKNNTGPVSTGLTPNVVVEPRLNWAIVTPGGAGSITIVDLGRAASTGDVGRMPNVVAIVNQSASVRGIAINTETEQALITDPNSTNLSLFSLLDETVASVPLDQGEVAAAVNPLTDVGVTVNNLSDQATVVDLRALQVITTVSLGNTNTPEAVAVDPGSNEAVVVTQGSGGSGTAFVLSLGNIRSLHITELSPSSTLTSASSLTLTVTGHGFVSGSTVRLDETPLPAGDVTFANDRQLVATIPASMLGSPRLYAVDVMNPGGTISNESDLTVMEAVPVGTTPEGVALDRDNGLAVVTNMRDNTLSVVNLTNGTVTPISVGTTPEGVAVVPRLATAVVANNGSENVSLVDLLTDQVTSTVAVGAQPAGVAANPDTAVAVIANSGANSVSLIAADSGQLLATVFVDQRPVGLAIDPIENVAAVGATAQNTLDFVGLSTHALAGRLSNLELPAGMDFDPVTDNFLVANSLQNNVEIVPPPGLGNGTATTGGINPVALAYNFQTSVLVTVNTASNTVSLMEFPAPASVPGQPLKAQVRAILPLGGTLPSPADIDPFAVAIDPASNLMVLVDQPNNRILLVPLPH